MEKNKENLSLLIHEAVKVISKLEGYHIEADKLLGLDERLSQERFQLAVLGQFKRGKSTLINALMGEEILPSSVIPLTAIATYLMWGESPQVQVYFLDKRPAEKSAFTQLKQVKSFLAKFVSEEENPKNIKGISHVEVFYPASFLKKGVVLLDTPGIGSIHQHNTDVALNTLTECDAALFLISADPPITAVEVEFLKLVKDQVKRLFFIINKIDYLTDREKEAVLTFFRNVLDRELDLTSPEIFCLSARQGLEAKLSQDHALWAKSAMDQISDHMISFLAREKSQLLMTVISHRAYQIVSDLLMRLNLYVRSLEIPLAELDKKLQIFDAKLNEAQQQRISVVDLLQGERKRAENFLEEEAEALRVKARTEINQIITNCLEKMENDIDERKIQKELDKFIPAFFAAEMRQMIGVFDNRITSTLGGYQQGADELIETIRKTAAELFDLPYYGVEASEAFKMDHLPYWVTEKINSTMNPLPKNLVRKLMPAGMRKTQITKQYLTGVEALVMHNVENLRWAILQNLKEAFWRFSANLEDRLKGTIIATHGVIKSTYEKRQHQSLVFSGEADKVKRDINSLKTIQEKLREICQQT